MYIQSLNAIANIFGRESGLGCRCRGVHSALRLPAHRWACTTCTLFLYIFRNFYSDKTEAKVYTTPICMESSCGGLNALRENLR
jgi:hypothetical protein